MGELSKVKRDLEAALKDVLQAMRSNQGAAASDSAVSLERLARVSASHEPNVIVLSNFDNDTHYAVCF